MYSSATVTSVPKREVRRSGQRRLTLESKGGQDPIWHCPWNPKAIRSATRGHQNLGDTVPLLEITKEIWGHLTEETCLTLWD